MSSLLLLLERRLVGLFHDVTVVVVVVVAFELDDEYPDGDIASGVTLSLYEGDGTRAMSSRRFSSFAGVGVLFLTGLKAKLLLLSLNVLST